MQNTKFTLFIHNNYTNSVYSAYQFAQASLAEHHEIDYIFFWRESVIIANKHLTLAGDDVNLQRMWQELSTLHNLKLYVCQASASRRGIKAENLADNFHLGSLGMLSEHLTDSHNLVSF